MLIKSNTCKPPGSRIWRRVFQWTISGRTQ